MIELRRRSFSIRLWMDQHLVCFRLPLTSSIFTFGKLPISPEAIVRCLSALISLEGLSLEFESPRSRPNQERRRLPPPTRSVLPSLTCFIFKGVSVYLEDLVARIDAPLLESLQITFFHQLIFDTPQLVQFVSRTPNLKAPIEAHVVFSDESVSATLPEALPGRLLLEILCRPAIWQLSSLAQVCTSSFPQFLIPAVEHLYISDTVEPQPDLEDDIENDQWLEVLRPFTAVKDLYFSREFLPRIVPTLQELVGASVTEVLPALKNLFLEEFHLSGTVQEAIEQFVAARQLANQPIAVSRWDSEREEEFEVADDLPVVNKSSVLDYSSVLRVDDSSVLDD
ncbi:hypothetical protein F5888DRAFT_1638378 [Russula emetica]|nr:hypothetical protein F5888DRAFT_1638378 [Russula emetica]